MRTLKRALICFLLISLAACSSSGTPTILAVPASSTPTPPPPSATFLAPTDIPVPMAITVGTMGITDQELQAELARYQAVSGSTVSAEQALKIVQDDLIAQLLLAGAAVEAGYNLDDAALQKRLDDLSAQIGGASQLTTWQQAHGYSDESFRQALKRSAQAAWMRDKIMSSVPTTAEQVHVRQILLYNEDVAKKYYEKLQAGSDFDELAAQVDPVTRGDIGWFPRGYLTDKSVEDAAFLLEPGAYSPIIPSDVGFHIIKVLERQAAQELSPDAFLALQKRALNDWLAEQRQKSNIILAP